MSERGRRNETDRPEGATVARREFDALADVVDGGVVRVDADGRVADATDAFATLTGRERADVVGGEFAAVFADPSAREVENAHRQLRDRIATSQGSLTSGDSDAERTAELTVHVETQPGERRTRELTLRAVAANGDPQGAVGVLRERSEETAVLAEREHVLRDVYNVCADASLSFEERVGELLATVRETVGTRYATLSRVDGDDYQFRVVDTESESDAAVEAGDTTELDQTNCERVVETEQTVVFRDIDEQAPELAARDGNRELGVSCYLGAPVVVDGEVRGTFCFYGDEAREDGFSAWEVTLVDLAAQWVEYELSHRETHERLERQAEELREAEQRYRTLVENFPNGAVALVNHDLEYTTAGGTPVDSALDSTDGLVGKTVHEAVSDDLADAIAPKYRAALDGERATFVHDNGDRVARIYTFPVRDDDGDVTAAMGMSQDVTEQKERERRLAEYEAIVETVNDGIYVVDEQGCYETVNDAFCDLTGYSRRELLGEHARLVVDGETMERAAAIREQSDVERPQLETTIETADGDEVPVEVAFSSLETDGETKRVGVVRDVTERRERRRRLAESEQRYRALVEHFPNGAVGLFDDELEYTAVGGEMLSDLDVSPDERVGRSVHDIYPERVAMQVEPHFRAALDGEQRSFEVQYDGRVVSAQTLPVRDADGDVDAGMLVVQDVTEQREQRRQLAESEQRYRALVENLPDGGVGVFDDDLRYTLVDGTMWDDIDVDAADLEGKTIWEALPDETAADVEPVFEAALDGETDSVVSTLGGRTYRVWATPLRDADGDVTAGQSIALDVTDQQARERELERTLDLLERTERIADVGGWEVDPETMDVFWSDHLFDILGVDADEEPPLEEALDVYHEADRAAVADAVEGALERGESFDVEARFHRPDGETRWLRVQGSPDTEDGDVVSLRGAAQDVTERKEREQFLEDAKAQMEAAAEAGAVGTWEWHVPDDRFVADAALARLFGVDPERARDGVSLADMTASIHEDDRDRVEAAIDRAVDTCGEYEQEYRVYDADGDERWVVARGHVECEGGDAVTFPGAITDITEQKRVERELERQRGQLETLFEVMPVGVVVADADGELLEANDVATRIWGGEVFDAEGVDDYDRYDAWWADSGERVGPEEFAMARVLDGEEVADPHVYEIEAANGEERVIMVHGMPVLNDGDVDRGVVTMTDVTERREYQRKLEASNDRLEQFAYAASHDLQEPLRMVSSYLTLVEERYGDELDDDGAEFIEYAVDGAERMQEMIDALLEYARVDTRGESLRPVELADVFADVRRDFEVKIEETDATVDVAALPTVRGDPNQLRQVFGNLLSNAIEYSGDGPPTVEVSAERDGDQWVVAVSDDGIGIDPEHVDRVFDVFQRLHSHDEHPGTGIGLALAERIVERHGGDVWVESEPGEGSTFYVSLPAVEEVDARD